MISPFHTNKFLKNYVNNMSFIFIGVLFMYLNNHQMVSLTRFFDVVFGLAVATFLVIGLILLLTKK